MNAATRLDIPYGKNRLQLSMGGDRLTPRDAEPIADEAGAVADALGNPIGTSRSATSCIPANASRSS